MPDQTDEINEVALDVVTPTELEALERAQVDIQIATAHRYPRAPLSIIKREIISFATLDEETAEGCFYAFNRGGKDIRGPSIRLAEMAMSCYGNLNAGAREIANDGKNITVQAVCHDLQRNVRICIEVKRKITDKNGKVFSEDMQTVTGNAARSIALRNAIFKVVPMALIRPAYDEARKVAVGDAKTLNERRGRAVEALAKMGVPLERVLAAVQKATVEDIDLAALELLQGLRTAIKDGESTIDEAFPAPVATKPLFVKKDKPAATAEPKPDMGKPAGHGDPMEDGRLPVGSKDDAPETPKGTPEEVLVALMAHDKITNDELAGCLRSFGKSLPRNFSGPGDMTDKLLAETVKDWVEYRGVILGERGNTAP